MFYHCLLMCCVDKLNNYYFFRVCDWRGFDGFV